MSPYIGHAKCTTKLAATVIAGLLLVPSAAFALSTSPATPATVSISGANGPKCTTLVYTTTANLDFQVEIHVSGERSYRIANVKAGKHSIQWCAGPQPQHHHIGPRVWWATSKHHKGDAASKPTATRVFNVVA